MNWWKIKFWKNGKNWIFKDRFNQSTLNQKKTWITITVYVILEDQEFMISVLQWEVGHPHTTWLLCDSDSVQHSLLSTSNISWGRFAQESMSLRFGLGAMEESGVDLLGGHTNWEDCIRQVFYVEISRKFPGLNVAKIFKKIFREFQINPEWNLKKLENNFE